MVRWDSPLFTIFWTDADIPGEGIWDALTKGVVKPPNAASLSVSIYSSLSLPFAFFPYARCKGGDGQFSLDDWQSTGTGQPLVLL